MSPKAVEYHLRKVFLKLGVSSRTELARFPLAGPDEAAAGATVDPAMEAAPAH